MLVNALRLIPRPLAQTAGERAKMTVENKSKQNKYAIGTISPLLRWLLIVVVSGILYSASTTSSQVQTDDAASVPTVTPPGNWTPSPTQTPGPEPTSTPAPYDPTLYISYREGAPGSIFTLSGLSFMPGEQVSLSVNGHLVGSVEVQTGSWFSLYLDTTQAAEGLYIVEAQAQSDINSEHFILDSSLPIRQPLDDPWFVGSPTFTLPVDIAFTHQMFLPMVVGQ
jgi:hypothetical protein